MITNGVGRTGKDIEVCDDFSIHVPYGWCYEVDNDAPEDESVLSLFRPESLPGRYKDGSFNISDETQCDGILHFSVQGNITVNEGAKSLDIGLEDRLKDMSKNAKNVGLNLNFNFGDSSTSNALGGDENNFHRMYKLVKEEPFLEAGYFTSGIMGKTIYNIIMITSHHMYTSTGIRFASDNHKKNEQVLDELLGSLIPLNVCESVEDDIELLPFSAPTYEKNIQVEAGTISLVIPDGMEYVTDNHCPKDDEKAKNLLRDYLMVAVPTGTKGGLRRHKDASMGINVSKPQPSGVNMTLWNNLPNKAQAVTAQYQGQNIKFVKEAGQYIVGYVKGNECESDDEPYWVTYAMIVICGSIQYTSTVFFNTLQASRAEYEAAMEELCKHVSIDEASLDATEGQVASDRLGSLIAENGKLDGIKGALLFTKDVIFNNDDEITFDGTHHKVSGFQMNAEVINDYPIIVENAGLFSTKLMDLLEYVEANENLIVPTECFHPALLKITKNNPITGTMIFMFCAWHMITIGENGDNNYFVGLDQNIIKGIPKAYSFVAEFIRTLREYNGIVDDFTITTASVMNMTGAIATISDPVRGADAHEAFNSLSFKKGEIPFKNIKEYLKKGGEFDQEQTKKREEAEQIVSDEVRVAFKKQVSSIVVAFKKFAKILEDTDVTKKKFRDPEKVVDYITDLQNNNVDELTYNWNGWGGDYSITFSYMCNDIISGNETFGYRPYSFDMVVRYAPDGDKAGADDLVNLKNDILKKIASLKKEAMYEAFLDDAMALSRNDNKLVLNASVEHALYQIIEANKKKTVSLSIKSKAVVGAVKKLASVFDKKMKIKDDTILLKESESYFDCPKSLDEVLYRLGDGFTYWQWNEGVTDAGRELISSVKDNLSEGYSESNSELTATIEAVRWETTYSGWSADDKKIFRIKNFWLDEDVINALKKHVAGLNKCTVPSVTDAMIFDFIAPIVAKKKETYVYPNDAEGGSSVSIDSAEDEDWGIDSPVLDNLPMSISIEGTAYEGRNARIEKVKVGDRLILRADYDNEFYDPVAIEVLNEKKQSLGYLTDSWECQLVELAKVIDEVEASVDSVTPLSARRKNAKYALMDVKLVSKRALEEERKKQAAKEAKAKKSKLTTTRKKIDELKEKLSTLELSVSSDKEIKESATSKLAAAESEFKRCKADTQPRIDDIEAKIKSLDAVHEQAEKSHKSLVSSKKEQLAKQQEGLKEVKAAYEIKQDVADIYKAKADKGGLFKKKKIAQYEEKQAEADAAKSRVDDIQVACDAITREINEAESKYTSNNTNYTAQRRDLNTELDQEKARLTQAKSAYDSAKKKYDEEMKAVVEREKSISDVKKEIDSLEKEATKLEKEIAKLES